MSYGESMSDRRTPEVVAHIDGDFAELSKGKELQQDMSAQSFVWGYSFRGESDNYKYPSLGESTDSLLNRNGLHVLDIGCGAGGVVRAYNRRNSRNKLAYGITANSYGVKDSQIIVGNVHYLDDLYPDGLGSLDLSVTQHAFEHLADPLSVIEMVARRVKTGGQMVIDNYFNIRARAGSMVASHVLKYLVDSGHYEIIGHNATGVLNRYVEDSDLYDDYASYRMPATLLKRKSKESKPLNLPVSYDMDPESGQWQYFAA